MRSLITLVSIVVILFTGTSGYARHWEVYEDNHVNQSNPSFSDVLPAEDMDSNHPTPGNINWYGGPHSADSGGVRFYPSWNWGTPQEGDTVCWLYDGPDKIIWWQGTLNKRTSKVHIQLIGCDSNDGWVDIYVDDKLEYSYNSYHATGTHVTIIGHGLNYTLHKIKLQTRKGGGDVSIDYVAGLYVVFPTLTQWALIILTILVAGSGIWLILRKRRAVRV